MGALAAMLALAALALPASAGAAPQTTTIDDDGLAPGTAVAQYPSSNPEIRFVTPGEYGFATGSPGDGVVSYQACGGAPTVEAVGAATHSPPNALGMSYCGALEFPFHGDFAVLTETADEVSAYVGNPARAGARFELDAYDVARKLIASKTVTAAEAAITTPLALTAPNHAYTIAFVAIYEISQGNAQFSMGMDDFSVQWGEGKPSISLASSLHAAQLAQSAHVQFHVSVIRHNHSNGEVQLSATGLPAGVHAGFGEDPLTGTNTSTPLTIEVDGTAPLGSSNGALKAVPTTPAAGENDEEVPIAIQVVAPFGVYVGSGERVSQPSRTKVSLPPCSAVAVPVTTILGPGFEGGPINLALATGGDSSDIGSVSLPLHQLINPITFGLDGVDEQALTVTSNGAADPNGATFEVAITPTAGQFSEPPAAVEVEKADPRISSMYNYASTPQLHHPGSEVTIKGIGFCPGAKVTFGNSGATVSASYVNSDGTELRATTPMLATSGPVTVESAGRTATSPEPLHVQSFRNTWGFSWKNENYGMHIDEKMIEEIFGEEETHESIEHIVTWRKPNAWLYEELTNKYIGKGICFGMAFSSLEFRNFPALLTEGEFPGTSPYPWALSGPSRPSDPLLRFAIENFSLQFTDQLIPVEVHAIDSIHSTNEDIDSIEAGLNENYGEPVMIGLIEWKGLSVEAHTVLAYDTRPLGGGSVEVRLYNPNTPFTSGEETDAKAHEEAELTNSQLIMKDGRWSFPEKGWSGSEADMIVYRHSELPIINGEFPKLPGLTTLGKVLLGMGSGDDGVTQVSDGHGSLFAGGQLAPQSAWPAGVAPVPNFNSQSAPLQLLALDPSSSRPVTATVARSTGGGAMNMLLPGLQASLQAGAHQGQVDHVSVDPHTDTIGYRTSAAHAPLGGTLISAAGARAGVAVHPPGKRSTNQSALGDRVVRFHLDTGSGDSEHLSLPGGRELVLRHSGAPTTISVQLSAFTAHAQPVAVALPPVRVGSGATVRVRPQSWRALGATRIVLTTSAHGRTTTRLLRGHGLARRFATVRGAQLGPVQRGRAHLDVSLALHHPPAGASVMVSASVAQHGHLISKPAPSLLRGGAAAGGNVALALPRPLRAGRYQVHVRLLEISSSGAIQSSTAVARTLGLRVS